jgi:ferrochelatase
VVGIVLAPHTSSLSTGEYHERARLALAPLRYQPVGAWWHDDEFIDLVATRVVDAIGTIDAARRETTEVVFSAHSLPVRVVQEGADYPDQLRDSGALVAARAGVTRWSVAWQSAGRTPDPWLEPDIRDVLRHARDRGVTDVVSCAIGFVADHLEVLYDLDIEAAAVADEVGVGFVRTASLNDDPAFTRAIARLITATA